MPEITIRPHQARVAGFQGFAAESDKSPQGRRVGGNEERTVVVHKRENGMLWVIRRPVEPPKPPK